MPSYLRHLEARNATHLYGDFRDLDFLCYGEVKSSDLGREVDEAGEALR